jgi:chemotaxis methyl-accepting protein methylase
MSSHNYIKRIIEEALEEMLAKHEKKDHKAYRDALRDHIFSLLADKYTNETMYVRTQTIDLQLKADVVRELRPAMDHLSRTFGGTQSI